MSLILITAPAIEPISLATARLHLRIDTDNTADDELITAAIVAARQQAEHRTGRALITQTWEVVLDAFPAAEISLGHPPAIAISSVKYIDTAGVEQTLAGASYVLDSATEPGYVLPVAGTSWPAAYSSSTNVVRVRFTAGYGAAADAVPSLIRQWMLLQIGAMYRNREAFQTGISVTDLPSRYTDALLDPFRTYL